MDGDLHQLPAGRSPVTHVQRGQSICQLAVRDGARGVLHQYSARRGHCFDDAIQLRCPKTVEEAERRRQIRELDE
ncbi:hypothetical protein SDC9_206613 [bioreactor metagenome]|uniref:Uncharacterized protein n=1 Tax=bioreactor metagenome TaxID=1076179 RepID=A0A645J678_9ZZZZ